MKSALSKQTKKKVHSVIQKSKQRTKKQRAKNWKAINKHYPKH